MKIAIGADNLGFKLKESIIKVLMDKDIKYTDIGTFNEAPVDYPDIAVKVADMVASGEYERGILICGTGIGMAISANKVNGIRAAVCHDMYSAERAVKSNNTQIIALGALVVGEALARGLVNVWLNSEFTGGPSAYKIEKIKEIEKRNESS